MSEEIARQDRLSAIQALRALRTLDGDDQLSIIKTAIKEGKGGLAARGISLLQRWNEERFWNVFLDEIDAMREAGRIREDLRNTDAGAASLREFFELIDGKPDHERFRAFCALFMSANAPDADANEEYLDLELMGILRKLSAGEMRVLSAFLKVREFKLSHSCTNVLDAIISEMGGNPPQTLVRRNATALVSENLVNSRWSDAVVNPVAPKMLLTDLGLELLKRIEKYNEFNGKNQESASR